MLKDALKNWADWGLVEKPRLVRVFDSGHNHHTGLIESGDKQFVVKIFKHSFNQTIKAEYVTSEREISPKLYMAANNVALYEFIEDQGYAPSKLSSIAQTLKIAHQCDTSDVSDFNLLGFCDTYLVSADLNTHEWHTALMPALVEFVEDPNAWTFCHNDLVTQNCMFKSGAALLIDWEFAQRNNPWFDLAAIIHYFELNNSQAQEFLSRYQQDLRHKTKDRIFYTSQIAVLWCDLLWSMHTLDNGNYKQQNKGRFEKLRALAKHVGIELPTQS